MNTTHRPLTLAAATGVALAIWILAGTTTRTAGQPTSLAVEYVNGLEAASGEVLVRLRPGTPPAVVAQLQRDLDAASVLNLATGAWLRIRSNSRSAQTLLDVASTHAAVERAEPNYIVRSVAVPNDPQFSGLWGLLNVTTPNADIHAANAWEISTGGTSTVVGVVDSGVDYTHPDLAANMWSAPTAFTITVGGRSLTCPAGSHGFNAIAFSQMNDVAACNPMDDNNHGTHTAGTIGAVGNNGTGVAGVNWTARIMALKFLNSGGSGSVADAVNAIEFAIRAKAFFSSTGGANVRVLSNSWGSYGFSNTLLNEITQANNADILFPAAAGNDANNNDSLPFYPASYNAPNVISVAATDINDLMAGFSNFGHTTVHLGAPGVGINSTVIGGFYGQSSGTSMATPHVAGVANLVLSKCTLTTAQLKAAILNNVDVVPGVTGVTITNGRLNADKAIRSCAPPPPSGGSATATFAGTDTTTQGSWRGAYGSQGYNVIDSGASYPSYATVTPSGHQSYTWAATTTETRGLQKVTTATDRIASTWFSDTSYTIDVNITDGQTHRVSLYALDWDSFNRAETIEVRDATTNALLDSQSVTGFHGGVYLKWMISGHVAIRVIRTGALNAVISGLFFDVGGNPPPNVELTTPTEGAVFAPAPANITLTATATDADGIDHVEFYAGGMQIGSTSTLPYGGTWSNVPAGSYTLTAKAFDKLLNSSVSPAVHITVAPGGGGAASAAFMGSDNSTQGNWRGVYGTDGFNIIDSGVSYPSYAIVTPSGHQSYTWAATTPEARGLQKVTTNADRLAATWFSTTSFTIDVNLLDAQTHQLALYCLDWDSFDRAQTIEIRDGGTNALLDTQTISGFHNGRYLKWNISGHVKVQVTRTGGLTSAVSGLFFDPGGNAPPSVALTSPAEGAVFSPAPATITLSATATDADGIDHVEFYNGATLIGTSSTFPYGGTWSNVAAGSYTLTAKAFDTLLNAKVSAPVHITVSANGGGGGTAAFLGVDNTTQGNWRNAYGSQGYEIINSGASYPAYALVTPTGHQNYTWGATVTETRGLQKATTASDRLAATWFGDTFSIDVNLIDGQPHQLALYFLDWDTFDRAETIEVRDAASNVLLDTRVVTAFHGGRYLKWTVSGHVKINVIKTGGMNAVLSGLFFDQ